MLEYLQPLEVTQHVLAIAIGVPPRRINEIVQGKRRITTDTTLRLARYFGTSEHFWLNLQDRYDIEVARDRLGTALDQIRPSGGRPALGLAPASAAVGQAGPALATEEAAVAKARRKSPLTPVIRGHPRRGGPAKAPQILATWRMLAGHEPRDRGSISAAPGRNSRERDAACFARSVLMIGPQAVRRGLHSCAGTAAT
jgi:addiction module HigA family antidote